MQKLSENRLVVQQWLLKLTLFGQCFKWSLQMPVTFILIWIYFPE